MAPSRKAPPRRPPSGLRRPASSGGEQSRGREVVESSPRQQANADLERDRDSFAAVIGKAATEFGSAEVEPGVSMAQVLVDPGMRANAARWRPSTESRKVTALFARLLDGLQRVRPTWLSSMRSSAPPAVEPLPLRIGCEAADDSSWWRTTRVFGHQVLRLRWRTMLLLLLILVFPRIFALGLTTLIRLLVRAVLAILARVGVELGRELHHMLLQLNMATFSVEAALLDHVNELFGFGTDPQPPMMSTSPAASPQQLRGEVAQCPLPSSSPPPWALCHSLLLVVDIFLRTRHLGGAGVP